MEEEAGFDSVQWDRADHQQSAPSPTEPHFMDRPLPDRTASDRRTSTASNEPQAGENADAVDLAGIGESGVLDCNVGNPRKENDGTKDAYVSYEIATSVS